MELTRHISTHSYKITESNPTFHIFCVCLSKWKFNCFRKSTFRCVVVNVFFSNTVFPNIFLPFSIIPLGFYRFKFPAFHFNKSPDLSIYFLFCGKIDLGLNINISDRSFPPILQLVETAELEVFPFHFIVDCSFFSSLFSTWLRIIWKLNRISVLTRLYARGGSSFGACRSHYHSPVSCFSSISFRPNSAEFLLSVCFHSHREFWNVVLHIPPSSFSVDYLPVEK